MPKIPLLSQYKGQKMKRLDQQTGKQFAKGDRREDGKVFSQYTKQIKKDGFFKEIWVSQESLQKTRNKNAAYKKQRYTKNTSRLPYGDAHLFKNNPRALEMYKDFCENPPNRADWAWLDDDLMWLRKYFTS